MQDVRKVQLLLFKSLQNWGRRVSVGKVYHRRIEKNALMSVCNGSVCLTSWPGIGLCSLGCLPDSPREQLRSSPSDIIDLSLFLKPLPRCVADVDVRSVARLLHAEGSSGKQPKLRSRMPTQRTAPRRCRRRHAQRYKSSGA